MPSYIIEHKIETLLHLKDSFSFRGFHFEPFGENVQSGTQRGWLARKTITNNTVDEGLVKFLRELFLIVDRISFVGQCHTTAELQPFIIMKKNDDCFFLRWSEIRAPVRLPFDDAEMRSLQSLECFKEDGDVFGRMRDVNSSSNFSSMAAMRCAALRSKR